MNRSECRSRAAAVVCCLLGSFVGGCSSSKDTSPAGACAEAPVNRFMELEIVEPAVISDARSQNATAGPWSFRHAVENMAPTGADPGEFVARWFNEWVTLTSFNNYNLDHESRASGMRTRIMCPWFRRTAANGCNEDCSTCAVESPTIDLALAPFRLIAIANRMDIREQAAAGPYGEGRLVFALTDGPADDPASVPLAMTMIFEYNLTATKSLGETAASWHSLGRHASFDEAYRAELQTVTDGFVSRGANPSRPNGSAIAQVRTNESALNWIWQLRQFELSPDGQMHLSTLKNNAAEDLNDSPILKDWIRANAAAIKADKQLLPQNMLSGSANQLLFRWTFSGIDNDLRAAFVKGTCNGCHSDGVTQSIDTAFHVSPFRTGIDKLSPFVNNPANPESDDLGRRTKSFQTALCSP